MQVGLFDEEIFAYSEDVELGLRMVHAGHRTAFVQQARAVHLGSGTLGHRSDAQQRLSSWSRGYVLGRYRVSPLLVGMEFLLALVDALGSRRLVPIRERARGYRRGRSLPARARPDVEYLPLKAGLAIRWASFRGRY